MRSPLLVSIAIVLPVVGCDAKDSKPTQREAAGAETPVQTPPDAPVEEVDAKAAYEAFGCDDPADDAAKRACRGLDAFGRGKPPERFPSEGTAVHLARMECTKDPNDLIKMSIAKVSAGGSIAHQFEAWPKGKDTELSAQRIMGDLERGGEPTEPSPEESPDGYPPRTLDRMRETWEMVPPIELELAPAGKSLREAPERPGAGEAFWRETNTNLVRVSPPSGKYGWCVGLYHPVPEP
ncbi:MAG: hypothetical protein ACE37F_04190 [Nannocystaceae bacterium]|nr:hypothetical protein [bacterium]